MTLFFAGAAAAACAAVAKSNPPIILLMIITIVIIMIICSSNMIVFSWWCSKKKCAFNYLLQLIKCMRTTNDRTFILLQSIFDLWMWQAVGKNVATEKYACLMLLMEHLNGNLYLVFFFCSSTFYCTFIEVQESMIVCCCFCSFCCLFLSLLFVRLFVCLFVYLTRIYQRHSSHWPRLQWSCGWNK